MKKLALITAVLSLIGCSSTPQSERREWINISCNGFADWYNCYQKAQNLCPNGYDSANRDENLITQGRSIRIACK